MLPLLQGAGFADWWELRAGLIEVQVLDMRTDLFFGQQEGAVVPAQTGDQACALSAVEAAEVTLQIIARIATGATAGQSQAHVHQWAEHVLAEVAGHGSCRDVPALFRPVGIVELDQQTPVMPLRISGARQNLQRRTHRACLAIVTGIKHAFGCQAKAAGQQIIFRFCGALGRWFGFNFGWFDR
ncbi:hypothetical protein D9M71_669940 [compost metagenome]